MGDGDPIDTALSLNKVTPIEWLVPFEKSMVVFTGGQQQLELRSLEALTPLTATLLPTTQYDSHPNIQPDVLGSKAATAW